MPTFSTPISHILTLYLLTLTALAHPHPQHKPAYFLLAGDSTTATQSTDGGGWGDGFLNRTLLPPSSGHNYGHNGATTASFRAGGDWATVVSEVKSRTNEYTVYVTIQFGHNDQKNTSGVTLDSYSSKLQTFATEIHSAGGIPILLTPLTRRTFANGHIVQDLLPQRNITISAALSTNTRYIDLNAASTRYCDSIGETAAQKYDLVVGDNTHLNDWGSVVFGRLVSDLMVEKYRDVGGVTRENETLSRELREGVPA